MRKLFLTRGELPHFVEHFFVYEICRSHKTIRHRNILISTMFGLALLILLLIIVVFTLKSMFVVVEPTEKRVLIVMGEYKRILDAGLNTVPPFVSTALPIDITPQEKVMKNRKFVTNDNGAVKVTLKVYYVVDDVDRLYRSVDSHHSMDIRRKSDQVSKEVIGSRNVDDIINNGDNLSVIILARLESDFEDIGISVHDVVLEDIETVENPSSDSDIVDEVQDEYSDWEIDRNI